MGGVLTVHTEEKEVMIPHFEFCPFSNIQLFLSLPDDVMLQYSPTSDECEPDDFCELVRESFVFVRDRTIEDLFSSH